jgi:predicted DCC family thiol-disulfide oxidoreductase YuxK
MDPITTVTHPVILFDGVCNLCSGSVQFIIKHDPEHYFHFASLQSAFGQDVLVKYKLPAADFDSFILLDNDQVYTKSTAALRVVKKLNGLWPSLYGLVIIPRFIRNAVYNLIAKNRYKWFGKQEACWLPTPELKGLFIDQSAAADIIHSSYPLSLK